MSQTYTRMVKTVGDVNVIFDRMVEQLKTKGFRVVSAQKPNLVIADRGTLRPTRSIKKYAHSLVVAYHMNDDSPMLSFSYIMGDLWDVTPGDEMFFNDEINQLVWSLNVNFTSIYAQQISESSVQSPPPYIAEIR